MRVLVDSSVWIDFFKNKETVQVQKLVELLNARDDICICGFVLTEVLQGIKDEKQYTETKLVFNNFIYLEESRATFELGATIYRELRKKGVTIRNSIDCLIAAIAIQNDVRLLENDRDYFYIEQHYPLHRLGIE